MSAIGKSRIILFTLCYIVVAFILFCSKDKITDPGPSQPKKGIVKTTVIDDSTSSPIEGAAVIVNNAVTGTSAANGTTDSIGESFLEINADTSCFLNVTAS